MKKIFLVIILFALSMCDKIDYPYIEQNSQSADRVVLVEKYTGHKCSNCPDASRKIDELKFLYKDAIIPIAIHPGGLPEFTSTDNNYPYDFTTTSGSQIAEDMGASFLPLGSVNRIQGDFGRCFIKDQWATEIEKLLFDSQGNPLPKEIEIEINSNVSGKNVLIESKLNKLEDFNTNLKYCLVIIEDSIISPQVDGENYVSEYIHNYVYRFSVNSTYGEIIQFNNDVWSTSNEVSFDTSSNNNWDNNWNNFDNCYVVGYVYREDNNVIIDCFKKKINE